MVNRLLRIIGILIPILAGLLYASLRPSPMNQTTNILLWVGLAVIGLVAGFLLRFWGSIVIVPLLFELTFWPARSVTCPDCAGLTYEVGLVGLLLYGIAGLSPMIVGAALGTFAGKRLLRFPVL